MFDRQEAEEYSKSISIDFEMFRKAMQTHNRGAGTCRFSILTTSQEDNIAGHKPAIFLFSKAQSTYLTVPSIIA